MTRNNSIILQCLSCGEYIETSSPSAILSRGYWWHRKCAKMLGDMIDFPSDGKLCPRTILTHSSYKNGS
jgi:hypothetical protein